MKWLHSACTASLLAACAASQAAPITLDFENIQPYPNTTTLVTVGNYYNGGTSSNGRTGPNYGVSFVGQVDLICLNTLGTDCQSNASQGGVGVATSQKTAAFFENTNPIVNVAGGFTTGFAFDYANPDRVTLGVQLYSGLNGTGSLVDSAVLPGTPDGATFCAAYQAADFCPFPDVSLAFAGTVQSIVFTGSTFDALFDDLTFGSTTVGAPPRTTSVPEPATAALFGVALAGLALTRRRRARSAR